MNSMGPIIAATAASANARHLAEEEERMTTYNSDDLENNWEFKIVRGNSETFRKHEALTGLVNEEKQAGWVLLEKLDNSRIRFKRQRAMQSHDQQLLSQGIDPYRTQYGTFPMNMVIALVGVVLVLMAGIIFMFAFTVKP